MYEIEQRPFQAAIEVAINRQEAEFSSIPPKHGIRLPNQAGGIEVQPSQAKSRQPLNKI